MNSIIKKISYLLFVSFLLATSLNAQTIQGQRAPSGMLFQAIAKDDKGAPASERDVFAYIIILRDTISRSVEYAEKFVVTTGKDGIFTINIGTGTFVSGTRSSINDINWGTPDYFLNIKIALKPTLEPNWTPQDNDYLDVGTSKLWSVPYSFYANRAMVADGALKLLNTLPSEMGGTGVANPVGKKLI